MLDPQKNRIVLYCIARSQVGVQWFY